jgi:hypothetical protein
MVHWNEVGQRGYYSMVILQWLSRLQWLPRVLCEVRAKPKEKVEQQDWLPQLTVMSSEKYKLRRKKNLSIQHGRHDYGEPSL